MAQRIREAIRDPDRSVVQLRSALVSDLNAVLQAGPLWESPRMKNHALPESVRSAAHQAPTGEALARLNRTVIEQAFPESLARMRRLEATQLNPVHAEHIATSPKAQDMAVNMFSGFWSLLLPLGVVVFVSLFTKPKPDAELKDLVYGLSPLPDEGPCPWYRKPVVWAATVMAVLVAVNLIFW